MLVMYCFIIHSKDIRIRYDVSGVERGESELYLYLAFDLMDKLQKVSLLAYNFKLELYTMS